MKLTVIGPEHSFQEPLALSGLSAAPVPEVPHPTTPRKQSLPFHADDCGPACVLRLSIIVLGTLFLLPTAPLLPLGLHKAVCAAPVKGLSGVINRMVRLCRAGIQSWVRPL